MEKSYIYIYIYSYLSRHTRIVERWALLPRVYQLPFETTGEWKSNRKFNPWPYN